MYTSPVSLIFSSVSPCSCVCRYTSAFGSPVARIQGVGWVQELIARLTKTRIKMHNTSTNATLDDNDTTFPLGHSLYVDATHEVVFLNGNLNGVQLESVTHAADNRLDTP
jgi:hypothetical protein